MARVQIVQAASQKITEFERVMWQLLGVRFTP